jgi:hypothetical protein
MTKQEIIAEFTPEMIKAVSRRFVMRYLGIVYFIIMAIATVAFLYEVFHGEKDWMIGAVGAIIGFGILFPLLLWWKTERGGLNRLRRMPSPLVKFIFDEKGIAIESDLGVGTLGWKSIEKIWEFPEAWLLFAGKQQHVTVPISALTEELKQVIKAEIEKNKPGKTQPQAAG